LYHRICGEISAVDKYISEEEREDLEPKYFAKYDPNYVYDADEIGFY